MAGEIILRDYQEDIIQQTRVALRKVKRVLIRAPTGSGKTALAAAMAGGAMRKGLIVFFVCHRDFLIDQTSKTFTGVGIPHAFVAAGWPWQPFHLVQICSIDTLKNRLEKLAGKPALVIWDEAHHLAAAGWSTVMAWCGTAMHVGLSATPQRLDGKGLDAFFDELVIGPSESWLMERRFLSRYRAFAPSTPDMTGVHTVAGDFNSKETSEKYTPTIVGNIVEHYAKLAAGKRAVAFCTSIIKSEEVAATFRAAGISALHLDGTAKREERRKAARAFAAGDIQVLTNVALFGEGYDLAAQAEMDVTIDCVIDAAPTKSLSLHLQKLGRALRPKADGSKAIFLDHAGNIMRHGFPDDVREWSLEGVKKSTSKGDNGPATRQCPQCFHVHRLSPVCPECGHVYQVAAREVKIEDGDLAEIDPGMIRHQKKMEEWAAASVDDLVSIGRRRGYQYPEKWAARLWAIRMARKLCNISNDHNSGKVDGIGSLTKSKDREGRSSWKLKFKRNGKSTTVGIGSTLLISEEKAMEMSTEIRALVVGGYPPDQAIKKWKEKRAKDSGVFGLRPGTTSMGDGLFVRISGSGASHWVADCHHKKKHHQRGLGATYLVTREDAEAAAQKFREEVLSGTAPDTADEDQQSILELDPV